jgi:hypothetical protein
MSGETTKRGQDAESLINDPMREPPTEWPPLPPDAKPILLASMRKGWISTRKVRRPSINSTSGRRFRSVLAPVSTRSNMRIGAGSSGRTFTGSSSLTGKNSTR